MNVIELVPRAVSRENFERYGTLVIASEDGEPYGAFDAQLEFSQGIPRFYVMKLPARPMAFHVITRHMRVTQCLSSVGGHRWFIAVAAPDSPDDVRATPDIDSIQCFDIPGDVIVKLHRSTWHAGPFFEGEHGSFFNLELADTNEADHHRFDMRLAFASSFVLGRQ